MSASERSPSDISAAAQAVSQAGFDAEAPAFTPAQIEAAEAMVYQHHTELGTLAGFEHEETEALYARALDDLRNGLPDAAIHRFLTLITLHPSRGKFIRGLALCYQHQRMWGWAHAAYRMALDHDADDGIAMALLGECALYTNGKEEAHKILTDVVQRGVRRPAEAPYVQRAQAILSKIKL